MQYYGNSTNPGAHLPFNFGLLGADKTNMVNHLDRQIGSWLNNMPKNQVANWVV